ncbi:MAG: RDD family protein [Solirubrobacterales bacterium]
MADIRSTSHGLPVIAPLPAWADPWRNPDLFRGIVAKRVIAYLIDMVAVGLTVVAVWIGLGLLTLATFGLLWPVQALAVTLVPLAYHSLLISSSRAATLGMRAVGIRVASVSPLADPNSGRPTLFQAMIQTVAFYGSMAATGSLVLVVALFNPRRRTLHDWLAGTVVVNDLGRWHSSPV